MRESIREFVRCAAANISLSDPIYEFGAFQVPGQESLSDLRSLFPGRTYVGCDMREGTGVDKVLNLLNIDLPEATAGTVLCLDTLEHCSDPIRAMEGIHRILTKDGIAVISSVMNFRIHDYPHDYRRFTPEAFSHILKPFNSSFVSYAGLPLFPHTVIGIGFKGARPDLSNFESACKLWQNTFNDPLPNQDFRPLRTAVRMLTPPILLNAIKKITGRP